MHACMHAYAHAYAHALIFIYISISLTGDSPLIRCSAEGAGLMYLKLGNDRSQFNA